MEASKRWTVLSRKADCIVFDNCLFVFFFCIFILLARKGAPRVLICWTINPNPHKNFPPPRFLFNWNLIHLIYCLLNCHEAEIWIFKHFYPNAPQRDEGADWTKYLVAVKTAPLTTRPRCRELEGDMNSTCTFYSRIYSDDDTIQEEKIFKILCAHLHHCTTVYIHNVKS